LLLVSLLPAYSHLLPTDSHQLAIESYREKAQKSFFNKQQGKCMCKYNKSLNNPAITASTGSTSTTTFTNSTSSTGKSLIAELCLNQTTPNLILEYPNDADAHFYEIRMAMAPWMQHTSHKMHHAAGYAGPWIENRWISHFESLYDDSNGNTTNNHSTDNDCYCLTDIFDPFVPLLLPWVDHWVRNSMRYPPGFLDALTSVLRPTVPYITVSQNDEGITGYHEFNMTEYPNILVLSAGGYGHVPIPLFKQEEKTATTKTSTQNRKFSFSYVGSLQHSPRHLRETMHAQLSNLTSTIKVNTSTTLNFYKYYYGERWRKVMQESKFSLVPRGYGRTAYHLMETLQMGLIPLYVYSDVPWIPYVNLYKDLGFMVSYRGGRSVGLVALVQELHGLSMEHVQKREERIRSYLKSHFTVSGVLSQLQNFMLGTNQNNDLVCQRLPRSVRDK